MGSVPGLGLGTCEHPEALSQLQVPPSLALESRRSKEAQEASNPETCTPTSDPIPLAAGPSHTPPWLPLDFQIQASGVFDHPQPHVISLDDCSEASKALGELEDASCCEHQEPHPFHSVPTEEVELRPTAPQSPQPKSLQPLPPPLPLTASKPGILLPSAALRRSESFHSGELGDESPCRLAAEDFSKALTFLGRVPFLRRVPKQELPLLVQRMIQQDFMDGQVVLNQGDDNNGLFIILSGQAEVVRQEGLGPPEKLVTLRPGDYFGEQELLHPQEARATVLAARADDSDWADGPALSTLFVSHDTFWGQGLQVWLTLPKRRPVKDFRMLRDQIETMQRSNSAVSSKFSHEARQKTQEERTSLSTAIRANNGLATFCHLNDDQVDELVDAARRCEVQAGQVVVRQGDVQAGSFYVVQDGAFQLAGRGCRGTLREGPGNWEARVEAGGSWGEQELIYSKPSLATVTALETSTLWVISHTSLMRTLKEAVEARVQSYVEELRRVNLFSGLYNEELKALAEVVTEVEYEKDEAIVTAGEDSFTCFVVVDGTATIFRDGQAVHHLAASRAKRTAVCCGEEELLRGGLRVATVMVTSEKLTALAFDKATFDIIIKPLDELLQDVEEQRAPGTLSSCSGSPRPRVGSFDKKVHWWSIQDPGVSRSASEKAKEIRREDLELRGQLGSGASGTVELAVHRETRRQYALKRVRRSSLADSWSKRQIMAEKAILTMTSSPFVVKLYATYRDTKALSFLFELVDGGDLLHTLCIHQLFNNEEVARFYAVGLSLALKHIHERRIIHRDLKPENVLLDAAGWPKLSDFGLAKFCIGKSYTMCGTLNYMAPETLSQRGQSEGVDWWALGVLTYEMMASRTPFESPDQDDTKMCASIQRGISDPEAWPWPDSFPSDLRQFIAGLLEPHPSRRFPLQRGRFANVKSHPWLGNFQWDLYEKKLLPHPASCFNAAASFAESASSGEQTPVILSPSEDWGELSTATSAWDEEF